MHDGEAEWSDGRQEPTRETGHGAIVFGPGVDRRVDEPSVSFVDLEPE